MPGTFKNNVESSKVSRQLSAIEKKTLLGFLATIMLLLAVCGYTYHAYFQAEYSAQMVVHTYQVRTTLSSLYAAVADAESANRNFLLSNNRDYILGYDRNVAVATSQGQVLTNLVGDNPQQLIRAKKLQEDVRQRVSFLERAREIFEKDGLQAAREFVASEVGPQLMESIQNSVQVMDSAEDNLLSARKESYARDQLLTLLSLLVTFSAALVGFLALFNSIRKEVRSRLLSEASLRKSELRYRTLFDSIDQGFCILEVIFNDQEKAVDYRFLEINPSFEKQSGLRDAVGKTMLEIAPLHETYWFEIFGRIALTGQAERFQNYAAHQTRTFDVFAFRFGDPANRQVACLFADISESIKASKLLAEHGKALEIANKELEAFSYSVSHDLRAPLRAIHGFSNILRDDHADKLGAEGVRLLMVMEDNTKKMGNLIDDLLAFSRISRVQKSPSLININKLVQEVLEELKPILGERQVEFKIAPLPDALADRSMLKQVLVNLISNAVKFTELKTTPVVEVGSKIEDEFNTYYVRDNGVGFDMQYVNKLFGIFQRLHSQQEFPGTGVGLAIVHRIVHRHGGRVWAEGQVGEGATFYFSLPTHNVKMEEENE